MQKARTVVKVLILTLLICMDNHACEGVKEATTNPQTLSKETRETSQILGITISDPGFLRFYEIVLPTQQEISLRKERSMRESRAAKYLQKTKLVAVTSLNIATVIYLEDNVGKEPTIENITTTLNFLGLRSTPFLATEGMN